MRIAFFAIVVVALAGCYGAQSPARSPKNQAEAPSLEQLAKDTLAFLPRDSEIVIDADLARIKASPLWASQIEPQTRQLGIATRLDALRKACGIDYVEATARFTTGMKKIGDQYTGVMVVRGPDALATLACIEKQAQTSAKVTRDGEALLVSTGGPTSMAIGAVGRSTLVVLTAVGANRAMLADVLAAGSPLRSSPAFMTLHDHLEPSAAISVIANGTSPAFEPVRTFGIAPRWVVVTASITDSYVVMGRVTMADADAAQKLAGMIQSNMSAVRPMVERLEVRAEDANVNLDVVVTKAQAEKMLGLMGGVFVP